MGLSRLILSGFWVKAGHSATCVAVQALQSASLVSRQQEDLLSGAVQQGRRLQLCQAATWTSAARSES